MGTYRVEWPCCGSVTETDAWEPSECPICASSSAAMPNGAERPVVDDAAIDSLRCLAACAYQLAGYHDAPEIWLDRLSQAANGDPLPDSDTIASELLPYSPVVDDARMARALEWVRVMAMQDANGSHVPAIEEAIAAYDPNCGGRTVRVVDDAMVERALAGMLAHRGTFEGESQIEADDIRAALLAAYQQDNGGN